MLFRLVKNYSVFVIKFWLCVSSDTEARRGFLFYYLKNKKMLPGWAKYAKFQHRKGRSEIRLKIREHIVLPSPTFYPFFCRVR